MMKYDILSLYFVVFLLLPTVLGSSNSIYYSSADLIKSNKRSPSIISSVPMGLPVDPNDIKCHIPNCSGFGMRYHPVLKVPKMHKGIDFPAKIGTPIISTSFGKVIRAEYHRSYGNVVEVKSGNYTARYAHCKELFVKENDLVKIGQQIATVGSSGLSTGPHCHYEVEKNGDHVDPYQYIK